MKVQILRAHLSPFDAVFANSNCLIFFYALIYMLVCSLPDFVYILLVHFKISITQHFLFIYCLFHFRRSFAKINIQTIAQSN